MQFIGLILNQVLIPVATVFFILSGLVAAITSAGIEYSVFNSLFTSTNQTRIPTWLIASSFVVVLEYSKIYLHYLNGRIPYLSDTFSKQFIKQAKALAIIPTLISIICSICFTISTLDLAAYDQEVIDAKISQYNSSCQEDIAKKQQELSDSKMVRLEPYKLAKETAVENLNTFTSSNLSSKTATRKLQLLQESVTLTATEFTEKEQEFENDYQQQLRDFKNARETARDEAIAALTNASSNQYDNPILAHTLTVLAQTIFARQTYSRSCYLIISICISLVLSLFLEADIRLSQAFLAQPIHRLVQTSAPEKLRNWCNQCILSFIKAACAIIIYLFLMMVSHNDVPHTTVILGVISYMLTSLLLNRLPDLTSNRSEHNIYLDLYYTTRDCVLQGVVSFFFYLLLGFLFQETALDISPATVGIGLGSFLAATLNKLPRTLIELQCAD